MIGEHIKARREQKRITLSELARRVGISKGYLSNLEAGNSDAPSVYIVARIAQILGVTVEQLIAPDAVVMVTCPHCKGAGQVPLK